MTSLLASFTQLMTADLVGELGRDARIGGAQAQRGLQVVAPLLLGSLARRSESISGRDSIMDLLARVNLTAAEGGTPAPGLLLRGVLGPGANTISKAVGARLGCDAKPLLFASAAALLGLIGRAAREEKLNSTDIAASLQQQHADSMVSAPGDVRAVVTEAFLLSDRAEELKSRFTDAEWRSIRLAPQAVTLFVVTAAPSGSRAMTKEVNVAAQAMRLLVRTALPTSLVDVAFGADEGDVGLFEAGAMDTTTPRSAMLACVREAAAAVKTKSPVDYTSFGDTLTSLAQKVAEASKEGGFLGIGGSLVSEDEERAVAEIASTVW